MKVYFLTIEDDKVWLMHKDERVRQIKSVGDLEEFELSFLLNDEDAPDVFKSSTIDFPEEYTSNPDTIALAYAISTA